MGQRPKRLFANEEDHIGEFIHDMPEFKHFTQRNIQVTQGDANVISSLIIRRMNDVKKEAYFNRYESDIRKGLASELSKSLLGYGYINEIAPVEDPKLFNDRYLDIYVYLHLDKFNKELKGKAKLYIICRYSYEKDKISLYKIRPDFEVILDRHQIRMPELETYEPSLLDYETNDKL